MKRHTYNRSNGIYLFCFSIVFYALSLYSYIFNRRRLLYYAVAFCAIVLSFLFREKSLKCIFSLRNLFLSVLFSFSWYYQLQSSFGILKGAILCLILTFPLLFLVAGLRNAANALLSTIVLKNEPPTRVAICTGVCAFVCLLAFALYITPKLQQPGDTQNQLAQIMGKLPYSNVHSITHTLLLKSFLSIFGVKYGLHANILFQIISVSLLFSVFSYYFATRGISFFYQLSITLIVCSFSDALLPIINPLKDAPYAFCVILIMGLLFVLDTQQVFSNGYCFLLGVACSGTLLFRSNGILVVIIVLVAVAIRLKKAVRFRSLSIILLSMILFVGPLHLYEYHVLGTEKPSNGFALQSLGTGVAAALNDGKTTEAEINEISSILPKKWLEDNYHHWYLRDLLWGHDNDDRIIENSGLSVFNNGFILDMGEHPLETVKLYFKLLPKHIGAYLMNIIEGSVIVWGHFGTASVLTDNIMLWFILLLFAVSSKDRSLIRRGAFVTLPILSNTFSILISTVSNENRYLFPTFLAFPFI